MRKKKQPKHSQADYITVHPKNLTQKVLLDSLFGYDTDVVLVDGPAGVGKTFLITYAAVCLLKRGAIDGVYVVRPHVKLNKLCGIGFLPGTAKEKLSPLLGAIQDSLNAFCTKGYAQYLLGKDKIQAIDPEMLRGRSFPRSLLLLDEAQNAPPEFVKMFLTRMGEGSLAVVSGDSSQCDVPGTNGLRDAFDRLQDLSGVAPVRFHQDEVVRNGIITDIVERYALTP
jgi:phosphate starvation-inducible protein PhoH and related proteins